MMKNRNKLIALLLAALLTFQLLPIGVLAETIYSDGVNLGDYLAPMADRQAVYHTVHFVDWDDTPLGTVNNVLDGSRLTDVWDSLGLEPSRTGFTFVRWTPAETYITGDEASTFTFKAQYRSTHIYDLRIDYLFADGSQAALPYTGTMVYGDAYSVDSPPVVGFVADIANVSGTAGTSQSGAVALRYTVRYIASTGTPYRVEHYQQNITDDGYTLADFQDFTATTGATVTVNSNSYTGFTAKTPTMEAVIAADGSTVVKLYYDRLTYIITYNTAGGTFIPPFLGRYGATIPAVANPLREGYTFAGWRENGVAATLPTVLIENRTFDATWTARNNTVYTVIHWLENANDDNYSYDSMNSRTGQTGTTATYAAKTYTGFILNTTKTNEETVIINGDGTSIKNVYYSRLKYTLTFRNNQNNNIIAQYENAVKYEQSTAFWWNTVSQNNPTFTWRVARGGNTYYTLPDLAPSKRTTH